MKSVDQAAATAGMDLTGTIITSNALHTQRATADLVVTDHHGEYLMFIKDNQPTLLADAVAVLAGTDDTFADATRVSTDRGHGRDEQRITRTRPSGWAPTSPTPPLEPVDISAQATRNSKSRWR